MQQITKTIPAGGAVMEATRGLVLSVKSSTLPISAALNGGPAVTVQAGTVLDERANQGWTSINFLNPNATAVTVVYFIGDVPVQYQPGDNQQKIASTYSFGSLYVLSGSLVTVPSGNAGHQRKQIVFTVSSGGNCTIYDSTGVVFALVTPATPLTFETDATFKVAGSGNLYVGEIYYSA